MQFQVKGQDYFLAFVEAEKRFYLFAPTPQGLRRIPLYVDVMTFGQRANSTAETHLPS